MRLAHGIERRIELVDDGRQIAGIGIRNAAGNQHRFLVFRHETTRQEFRQDIDVGLQRARVAD